MINNVLSTLKIPVRCSWDLSAARQNRPLYRISLRQNLFVMKKEILVSVFFIASVASLFAQKAEVFNPSEKAIRGYDPVAYFTEGKSVKGNDNLTFHWKDANWYFSSTENLNLFTKNPEKYAPQYGGYCAYGMSEGHKAPTDPDAWTIVDGKLYLNYSKDVRTKWREGEKERIDKADKNWPQLKDSE